MAILPAAGYLSNAVRTEGEVKTALDDLVASIKQIPGAGATETTLTIASGSVTPPSGGPGVFSIDTEASAATDDLTNIAQSNLPDGSLLLIRNANASRVVNVLGSAGGAGQMVLAASQTIVLSDTRQWLLLKRSGTLWTEVMSSTLWSPVIKSGTVQAAPTVALGIANKGYVDYAVASIQDFRLTLTSGSPVQAADQLAKTTLYAAPYNGTSIALYDSTLTIWKVHQSGQMSIAVPATTSTPYDVWCYDNAGVPTLELTAWSNDTTRATALTRLNGILVKSGATTRRYLGSFRTTTVSGQTESSLAKRYLSNYYHRLDLPMRVVETTNSWTYTTAVYRQANGAAANQLDYFNGVNEEPVSATVLAAVTSTANARRSVGIGVDSTTVNSATLFGSVLAESTSSQMLQLHAHYRGYPGEGRHTLVWLEHAVASGVASWFGDDGGSLIQCGIMGTVKG